MNDGTARATARRRLIRGAFATPAVLTLYSGGVLAATSSQCDVKGVQSSIASITTVDDTYLRYQLWALVKLSNSATPKFDSYYIRGDDLKSKVGMGFQPKAEEWQRFDLISMKPAGSILFSPPQKKNYEFKQVQQYVVLRVDSNGTVVAVGDGASGLAVSDSCASSLVGAAVVRTMGAWGN
jgi:hypothetical protein